MGSSRRTQGRNQKKLRPLTNIPNLSMESYLLALIQLGALPKSTGEVIVRGKGVVKKKRHRNQRQFLPSSWILGPPEAQSIPLGLFISRKLYLPVLFFESSNNKECVKCCMQVCTHTEQDCCSEIGTMLAAKQN